MHISEGDLVATSARALPPTPSATSRLLITPAAMNRAPVNYITTGSSQELHDLKYEGWVGVECTPAKDGASAAEPVFASDE